MHESRPSSRLPLAILCVAAGWGLSLATGGLRAAAEEKEGDEVSVTLRSGRIVRGVLGPSTADEVKIVLGDQTMTLPRGMIRSIVPAGGAGVPAGGAGAPAGGAGTDVPDPGEATPTGERVEAPRKDEAPRPSAIELEDGSVVFGYVVGRTESAVWVIEGRPVRYAASAVKAVHGGTPASGGGGGFTADAPVHDRARALVKQLSSKDEPTVSAALAALESMGEAGAKALVEGLASKEAAVRLNCVLVLGTLRVPSTQGALLDTLKGDRDPGVRTQVAGILSGWYAEEVVAGFLDRAKKDEDNAVRAACLRGLALQAGPEEVNDLMGLLGWFGEDHPCREPLFQALRKGSGKKLTSDEQVWRTWYELDGGRRAVMDAIDAKRNPTPPPAEGE